MRWLSPRQSGVLILLGSILLAVSCEQRTTSKETEPAPPTSSRRTAESDFVVLDDDDGPGRTPRVTAEQLLVQEPPPPPQETKPPPLRRPHTTVAKTATIEDARREESEAVLEKRRAPHERASSEIVPKPRDKDGQGEPTTPPIYNPRLVVTPIPMEPPPPTRFVLPDVPPDRRDQSGWTTSDVMLVVGSLSTAAGAVAVAGDGGPEARIVGVSMLGVGLVSYGTAGILYLNEQSKSKNKSPTTPTTNNPQKTGLTSVGIGAGFSLGGRF